MKRQGRLRLPRVPSRGLPRTPLIPLAGSHDNIQGVWPTRETHDSLASKVSLGLIMCEPLCGVDQSSRLWREVDVLCESHCLYKRYRPCSILINSGMVETLPETKFLYNRQSQSCQQAFLRILVRCQLSCAGSKGPSYSLTSGYWLIFKMKKLSILIFGCAESSSLLVGFL